MTRADLQLREAVMWRVKVIYIMRQFGTPVIAESALILGCFSLSLLMVSLQDVVSNLLLIDQFQTFLDSLIFAFEKTEFAVQGLVLVMLIAGVFFVKDTVWKQFRFSRQSDIANAY